MELETIAERLGDAVLEIVTEGTKDPFLVVEASRIREVMALCRDDSSLAFDLLVSITGADYPPREVKKKAKKGEPAPESEVVPGRFELVYHLLSTKTGGRLVLKVRLPHEDAPSCDSISEVHPAAEWHEREAFDLLGIRFFGHPDLRRILCCEDWVGHPLRKDYVFPKEFHGISAE